MFPVWIQVREARSAGREGEETGPIERPIWTAAGPPGVPGEAVRGPRGTGRGLVNPGVVLGMGVAAGRSAAIREPPSGVPREVSLPFKTPDRSVN